MDEEFRADIYDLKVRISDLESVVRILAHHAMQNLVDREAKQELASALRLADIRI